MTAVTAPWRLVDSLRVMSRRRLLSITRTCRFDTPTRSRPLETKLVGWIVQQRWRGSAVYALTSNTLQGRPPSRHSGSCGLHQAKYSHQAKLCDSSGIWSCPRGRPCHECDTRGSGASALFAHFCDCDFSLLASSACQSLTSGATYIPLILTAGTVPLLCPVVYRFGGASLDSSNLRRAAPLVVSSPLPLPFLS